MNYIDIILIVPILWGIYKGFIKGLIIEAAGFVALALGVWGGMNFSVFLSSKIKSVFNWDSEYLPIISFAILFLGVIISIFLIASLLSKIAKKLALGGIDKLLGSLLGGLKFALILSVIIFIINAIEKSYPQISFTAKEQSLLYKPLGKIAPLIIPSLQSLSMENSTGDL
jgi:membrane protein required for colicin V production